MPRKKTAPPRRRLLKALAILVALGLVAFFSVFFFLRTTTGENYVFAFLQRSLASQGLTLTAGSFAGPLPLNVTATDVTLADSLGTFLTVRSLSAKVGFWNFFRGILKGEAAVVGADLKRQPLLPAAEEKPKKFSSPPFSLDLAVSLTESTVAGATLNPTNPGPQIAATVQTQLFYATDRLTFNLLASLLDDQGRGLKLAAALGRAESTGPETLNLDLALTDEAGIVALSRPDLPKRLSLTLKGQGPLHEWRGQLKLTGQDDAAASRETAASQEAAEIPKIVKNLKASVKRPAAEELAGATIVWRGRTGRVMEDLFSDPHFTGELDLWALAKLIPNEARPVLPNLAPLKPNAVLSLIAKAIRSPDEIQGDLALTTPYAALNSPKFVVTSDQGAYKISLNATLTPGQLFNLTLANPAIDLELAGLIEGQTQKFDRLTLKGEGLTALIAAENNPQSQDAAVTLTLAPDSVVYAILKVLAPLAVAPGALTVDLKANRDPNDATLKATGQVALANLGALVPNWGGAVLADFDLTGRPNDFKVNLTATSPSLSHPTGPYSQTSFTGVFDYQAVLDGLKVLGEVKLAAISPKAPLDLAATFDLERRPGEFFLSLANFKLAAPGVTAESQAFKLAIYPDQAPDLAGALTFKALDWPLLGSLIGQDLKGAPATLEARLIPGPLPVAEATLNLPELKAGDYLAIKDARLNLTASLGVDAKANLNLTQGPGRIGTLDLKSGRIEASAAGLWSEGLAGTVKIKLIGPTKDLLDLEGAYDLKAKTATLSQLRLGPPQLKNVLSLSHPLSLDLKDGLKFTDLNLALNQGGQLTASAEILGTSPYAIKLVAQSLPLNATDPGLIDLPAGVVNLKADYLEGTGGSFEVKTRLNGPPILDLSASGRLAKGVLEGQAIVAWSSGAAPFKLTYRAPLKPAGHLVTINESAPLLAEAAWRGPASQLWSLTGLEDMALRGEVDLKAKTTGSFSQPKTELDLYLVKGSFQDPSSGLSLANLNFAGHLDDKGEIQILAEGGDGAIGRLAFEGSLSPKTSPPSLNVRAQLDRLSPLHRDDLTLTMSALATLAGPLTALKLSAKAIIERAEISLAQGFGGPPVKTLDLKQDNEPEGSPLELDLEIEAPNQLYIRGRGLDSEWQANLRLAGAANKPIISGSIKPVRGYLELLAKQFTIGKGEIRFFESTNINPALNLELTRQASEILAVIRVSGTKDSPKITLDSQPQRPADEILAQILYGKNSSQLSRFETLQLANSLKSLTGVGPKMDLFTPLNAVRDTLGLSVLRFGETSSGTADQRILKGNSFRDNLNLDDDNGTSESTATVEAGKYINDRVYVGLEQDLGNNSTGVRVEVELTPNLNLESKTTTKSNRVGLGWKMDY